MVMPTTTRRPPLSALAVRCGDDGVESFLNVGVLCLWKEAMNDLTLQTSTLRIRAKVCVRAFDRARN